MLKCCQLQQMSIAAVVKIFTGEKFFIFGIFIGHIRVFKGTLIVQVRYVIFNKCGRSYSLE